MRILSKNVKVAIFSVIIILISIILLLFLYGRKNSDEGNPTASSDGLLQSTSGTESSVETNLSTSQTAFTDPVSTEASSTGSDTSESVSTTPSEKKTDVNIDQKEIPLGRSEELQRKIVPLSGTTSDPREYFKDSILIGDSVTSGVQSYKTFLNSRGDTSLDNLTVFAINSYGVYNAVYSETTHPLYNGKPMKSQDALTTFNVKRVFIWLGLNDIKWQTKENFIKYYKQYIELLRLSKPDVEIIILSTSPFTRNGEIKAGCENSKIIDYNNALIELAYDMNIPYVDVSAPMRDSEGYLREDIAYDDYCHIWVKDYNIIIDYLLTHQAFTN